MLRPYTVPAVEEVFHASQIPRSLFTDGGGEQHRPSRAHARDDHRLRDGDERRQAARVVADARALEPLATSLDGDIYLRSEHRVQVGREDDGRVGLSAVTARPAVHVADLVDRDVVQADG